METNQLYLKTAFCCMACDGDIAKDEVKLIEDITANNELFKDLDVKNILNTYVDEINLQGQAFLNQFLDEIVKAELTPIEQMIIVRIAIQMIEADKKIEYSEIRFFKKIRKRLSIGDDVILAEFPDKEDFLLPDIETNNDYNWNNIHFDKIDLSIHLPQK